MPCRLLGAGGGGFSNLLRLCKAGKKAGEGMGTGESQENMRVFSSVHCSVPYIPYATHRTFYSS